MSLRADHSMLFRERQLFCRNISHTANYFVFKIKTGVNQIVVPNKLISWQAEDEKYTYIDDALFSFVTIISSNKNRIRSFSVNAIHWGIRKLTRAIHIFWIILCSPSISMYVGNLKHLPYKSPPVCSITITRYFKID